MCGIVGILDNRNHPKQAELDRFTDSLAHRGPDGRGTWRDGCIALGHRRLAILDLTDTGKCPMPFGDNNRYWITYNGEVYNFIELRRELESHGHRFRSETDTEVIAAAYAQWGKDCLLRFNGMWAFAIWDSVDKTLFLARDRFGIKPFYYAVSGSRFAFASEMKAFRELAEFQPKLDSEGLTAYLADPKAAEGKTDRTPLEGVRKLPAGHCMMLDRDGKMQLTRWWSTKDHFPEIPQGYRQQVEQLRELFLDSVRLRMRSDVSIGSCLSGGIDSSGVVGALALLHKRDAQLERCPQDWQKAFIATFPDSAIDERTYAEEVVAMTDAKPYYWVFDGERAVRNTVDVIWSHESVYQGNMVPIWATYRELRRDGTVVTLDGHGADEMLGGYIWYFEETYNTLNSKLYDDFHQALPTLLRNFDRLAMAHGVEIRTPYLDWRLVSYILALPPETKIGKGFTKRVLRDALEGIIPDRIRERRFKMGFSSPMVDWFNGGMEKLILETIEHPLWKNSPYWDVKKIKPEIKLKTERHAWQSSEKSKISKYWLYINAVLWHRLFIDGEAPESLRTT